MSGYTFVANQGYSIESYSGIYNTNSKIGPIERAEEYRADQIDFINEERFRQEKRKTKYDDEDSW